MYNGANGDTFCEVLVSRRRGTPETVKAALAIIVGLLFSAVIILLVPMFFILLIPVWALVKIGRASCRERVSSPV